MPPKPSSKKRERLVQLARRIQEVQDLGKEVAALVGEFQQEVLYPNVEELFETDYSPETIADYAMGWTGQWPKLSREDLKRIVIKISSASDSEAEISKMVQVFKANCLHPAKSDLIFYPADHFGGNQSPSPDEIVDRAFSGK
jgi:hypothetical protein